MIHLVVLQVRKVRPNDRDAKMKYTECQKIVKIMLFQKAIAVDDEKKAISETIDLTNMGILLNHLVECQISETFYFTV